MAQIVLPHEIATDFHHHTNGRRRCIPDGDPLVLQDPIPTFGVEIRFVYNAGEPIRQRRDDAVGRAGYPARVGGTPEDIRRVEIERKFACDVVGHHGAMHVERPLGVPVVPLVKCRRAASSGSVGPIR